MRSAQLVIEVQNKEIDENYKGKAKFFVDAGIHWKVKLTSKEGKAMSIGLVWDEEIRVKCFLYPREPEREICFTIDPRYGTLLFNPQLSLTGRFVRTSWVIKAKETD